MSFTEKKFKIFSVIENLSDTGLCEGDAERTEICPVGRLTAQGGELKIEYSETTEGGRVDTVILISSPQITVTRRGAVVSEMHFAEGETHRSIYSIPPYSFDTEVYTKKIRNNFSDRGGRLDILYTMKIGGQDKKVRMRIDCE